MSVTAKVLINTKQASIIDNTEYICPSSYRTIIDKFTATNTDAAAQTLTINIVPAAGTVGAANLITKAYSIAAGATYSVSEMQNQILAQGDFVSVKASSVNIIIRMSGRECV